MQELAAEGVIPADFKVPCLVEAPDAALETSLMEKHASARPAPGGRVRRHGGPDRHGANPSRRSPLASAFRNATSGSGCAWAGWRRSCSTRSATGDISLEVVTAFTLGADHRRSSPCGVSSRTNSYVLPTVRRLLTESAIPLNSDLGRFVGIAAYEAAGGPGDSAFSSGDDEGFMDDAALVRRLCSRLEQKAAELRSSWAWTKAMLDPAYDFTAQYRRVRPQLAELPPEITGEIERLEERLAELEEITEDEWTDALMTELPGSRGAVTNSVKASRDSAVYSEKDRAVAGVIVTIGDDGEFRLHEKGSSMLGTHTGDIGDDEIVGFKARPDNEISGPSPTAGQTIRKECVFSQLLVDDLKAHRLQITRAHLAADFDVAFDLALYSLCVDLLSRFGYRSHPLDLRAIETPLHSSLNDLAGTPADRLLEVQGNALDLDWLKLPPAEGFAALAALSSEAKQRLFARCIALCLKPQLAIEDGADPVIEAAGPRLAIPFADYWRPTAANYWGRVKKAHGIAIGTAILGERWGLAITP